MTEIASTSLDPIALSPDALAAHLAAYKPAPDTAVAVDGTTIADQGTTWYLYEKKGSLTVSTGKTLLLATGAAQPPNSTLWAPPVAPTGYVAYWVTSIQAWHVARDVNASDLAALKIAATSRATAVFSDAVSQLNNGYIAAEQSSFGQQLTDARAIVTGAQPLTDLLPKLATARGIDLKVLATKIVDKSNAYSSAYAQALAQFQATRDTIQSAKTLAELPPFDETDLLYGIL